jgi:hypothetical protein
VVNTQVDEQLEPRQGRVRPLASVSDRSSTTAVEPVPRIALTQQEACASLGCSEEFSGSTFVRISGSCAAAVSGSFRSPSSGGRSTRWPRTCSESRLDTTRWACRAPTWRPRRARCGSRSRWTAGERERASGQTSFRAGDEHRGASRQGLRERTREALQLRRALPRRGP